VLNKGGLATIHLYFFLTIKVHGINLVIMDQLVIGLGNKNFPEYTTLRIESFYLEFQYFNQESSLTFQDCKRFCLGCIVLLGGFVKRFPDFSPYLAGKKSKKNYHGTGNF
jgi:hypothetical protein